MLDGAAYYRQTAEFIADLVEDRVTETYNHRSPSEWAEQVRYLPKSVTPKPGPFNFDDTPYWREVLDCMDPDHPARFVAAQKGAQVAATTGVLENVFGYLVDQIRSAPAMFATADDTLTQLRLDSYMIPMLQHSGLADLIRSNDEVNKRKQGATGKKVEWSGGGFLIPIGAKSPTKMRSFPVQYLLRDEVSGWPATVGRDADPMRLTETRTDSFELTRKVLDLSTPTDAASDIISKRFKLGDQRYYWVPCKHCGEMQILKFRIDDGGGKRAGLVWEMERTDHGHRVAAGSVRYVCPHCGGEMINEDKTVIMPQGEWRPSAQPSRPHFYSYHLSALYAPWYAKSWESCAMDWVEAWDDETNRLKDVEQLQVFYNNVLGEPFEVKTQKLKLHQVSPHKRAEYMLGEVPQQHAEENAGGGIAFLVCTVDVQDDWLAVAVHGFAPSADRSGYNPYLVDYFELEGDTSDVDNQVWKEMAEVIDCREYDGRRLDVTGVDAGHRTDTVYDFCAQWETGVYPLRGRDKPVRGARIKEFEVLENAAGTRYISAVVDLYKDRLAVALARTWAGVDRMPRWHWSAPGNLPDKVVKHMTVEHKREKRDPASNKLLTTYWHRPGGSRQELWDLTVYAMATFEVMAFDVLCNDLGVEALVWGEFWAYIDPAKK